MIKILDDICCIKKIKEQKKSQDIYFSDYYEKYLQLKVEIDRIKISRPLRLKISLGKIKLIKINKIVERLSCIKN